MDQVVRSKEVSTAQEMERYASFVVHVCVLLIIDTDNICYLCR